MTVVPEGDRSVVVVLRRILPAALPPPPKATRIEPKSAIAAPSGVITHYPF
jgi:hypothetical protein